MSKFDDLIKALEDLTQAVNSQSNAPSGAGGGDNDIEGTIFRFAAMGNLVNQLGSLGDKLVRLVEPVAKMEQSLVRVGISFDEGMSNLISGALPLSTRMQATTALVEAGLEKNSLILGQSVARSAALGENIQLLTGSFRDLRLSLNLNRTDLDLMSQTIERSAYLYKTSTTELTQEMANLARKISVIGMSGALQSNQAITEAIAMTQRTAPGVLSNVLGDLLGTGTGGLATSLMRGLEPLASRLVANQISDPNEIFGALERMIATIESTLGPISGDNFRVQTDLLQGMFGFSFEQVMAIKSMLDNTEVLTGQQKNMLQRSEEIRTLLSNLGPKLLDPLIQIALKVGKFLDQNQEHFDTFFGILVGSAFAKIVFAGFSSIVAAIAALATANSVSNSIPIIGGVLALVGGIASFNYLTKEFEQTQKKTEAHTGSAADDLREMNERERRRELALNQMDAQRELQQLTLGSIGRILAATQGGSLLDQASQQTRLTAELLEEMRKVNNQFEEVNKQGAGLPPAPTRVMRGK